jgi:curved DNA-binding protein CbpA
MKDYYAILGVSKTAEPFIVEAAWKALSKELHPDLGKGTKATERLKEVNEAHDVLKNKTTRAAYNKALRQEERAFKQVKREQRATGRKAKADEHVNVVVNPPIDAALAELVSMFIANKGGETATLIISQPEVKGAMRQVIAAGLRKLGGNG